MLATKGFGGALGTLTDAVSDLWIERFAGHGMHDDPFGIGGFIVGQGLVLRLHSRILLGKSSNVNLLRHPKYRVVAASALTASNPSPASPLRRIPLIAERRVPGLPG